MVNTKLLDFSAHSSEFGALVALEAEREIPFQIQRAYYIYGVPQGQRRGYHSHRSLEQVLICLHGCVKILVKTPFEEEVVVLDSPKKGLYIGPMIWREMFDWENEGVLMVLASKHYDECDYIRNYAEYEKIAYSYRFERGEQ